nr:hypothetical protein Iba_chr15cCG5450 [Ipomoea batatas]
MTNHFNDQLSSKIQNFVFSNKGKRLLRIIESKCLNLTFIFKIRTTRVLRRKPRSSTPAYSPSREQPYGEDEERRGDDGDLPPPTTRHQAFQQRRLLVVISRSLPAVRELTEPQQSQKVSERTISRIKVTKSLTLYLALLFFPSYISSAVSVVPSLTFTIFLAFISILSLVGNLRKNDDNDTATEVTGDVEQCSDGDLALLFFPSYNSSSSEVPSLTSPSFSLSSLIFEARRQPRRNPANNDHQATGG